MKILASCPRQLLLIDTNSRDTDVVERHRSEYYGISWTLDGQSLCLSHSGIDNAEMESIESYMDSEVGWISIGSRSGPIGLSAPHQILCTDRYLITSNTGRNCITLFDLESFFYRHYWVDDVRWDRKGKENRCGSHLNSMYLIDDRLHVVAHNFDRGSEVLTLSWPEMELIERRKTTAQQAHNVWVTPQDQTIICDTMRGTLIDVHSNDPVWSCDERNVLTRGLASDGRHVFVGRSEFGNRNCRTQADGGVWIVDYDSWKTVDYIHLPGVGNIHELRLLEACDLCHHGRPFRGQIAIDTSAIQWRQQMLSQTINSMPSFQPVSLGQRCHWMEHGDPFKVADGHLTAGELSLNSLGNVDLRDVNVRADVQLCNDGHVGVVVRYRGPHDNNMVVGMLACSDKETHGQIWSNVAGHWSCLATAPVAFNNGKLELRALGNEFELVLNNQPVVKVNCADQSGGGSVGIRSRRSTFSGFEACPIKSTTAAVPPSQRLQRHRSLVRQLFSP